MSTKDCTVHTGLFGKAAYLDEILIYQFSSFVADLTIEKIKNYCVIPAYPVTRTT